MIFSLLALISLSFCFASEPATPLGGAASVQQQNSAQQQNDFTSEYEKVINEYTKYLASVPKSVKEEEMKYMEDAARIDKEMARLNQQKVSLKSKLSNALKEHQATKLVFDKKLYLLSKGSSYRPARKIQHNKKGFNKKPTSHLRP